MEQIGSFLIGDTSGFNLNGSNLLSATNRSSSSTNFSGGAEGILAQLLQELSNGGTSEQQASRAQRLEEVNTVRGTRDGFTKQNAIADSNAAVDAQSRAALEQLLPSINNAARGAGSSQSSMRALLLQDAAQKAADSASQLRLKTITDFGNINTNLSSVLEALTRQENPQTKALLEAIQLSKGQQSQGAAQVERTTGGRTTAGGTRILGASPGRQRRSRIFDDAPIKRFDPFEGFTGSGSGNSNVSSIGNGEFFEGGEAVFDTLLAQANSSNIRASDFGLGV